MLRHGWRTGAIIPELEREIRIINTEQYMHSLTWQQALTGLLERMQVRAGRGGAAGAHAGEGGAGPGRGCWSACTCGQGRGRLLTPSASPVCPRPTRTLSRGRCWLPG